MRPRGNQTKRFALFRPSKGLRQVFKDVPVTQDLVRQTLRISAKLGNDLITALLFCLFTLLSVGGNSTRTHNVSVALQQRPSEAQLNCSPPSSASKTKQRSCARIPA